MIYQLTREFFLIVYHRPDDRPSLQNLLEVASGMIQEEVQGEDDAFIREWIQRLVFDAPRGVPGAARGGGSSHSDSDPDSGPPPKGKGKYPRPKGKGNDPTPKGKGNGPTPKGTGTEPKIRLKAATSSGSGTGNIQQGRGREGIPFLPPSREDLQRQLAQADPSNARRLELQARYARQFPNGHERIMNREPALRCGLRAIVDSLHSQLGLQPIINGVQVQIPRLPTVEDLLVIHQGIVNSGFFNAFAGAGAAPNLFGADVLCLLLTEWGRSVNIEYVFNHSDTKPLLHSGRTPANHCSM